MFNFWVFSWQRLFFLSPLFTINLDKQTLLHQAMKHNSIERHLLIVLAFYFLASFCQKSVIFLKQIRQSPLPTTFRHCDAHFPRRLVRSVGRLLSCFGKIVTDRGWNFWWMNLFPPVSFRRKELKNHVFFRGQTLIVALFPSEANCTFCCTLGMYGTPKLGRRKKMKRKVIVVFNRTFYDFFTKFGRKCNWRKWFFK